MVFITLDLLRRRSEHNEGCLSNLKEIALHQQEIERIEVVGDVCRQLEILYLCNNYIPRIEGLHHLKSLQYINLAVNNIKEIENLDGCEMLSKLDLTLNFVADMRCIANLRANSMLRQLQLTGNPCTKTPGYRAYVVHTLPHLIVLDSEDVVRSERIIARQDEPQVASTVETAALEERERERIQEEMIANGIDPFPPRFNEKGDRVYGHTPEERIQILREEESERKKRANPPKDPNSISAIAEEIKRKPQRLTVEEEMTKYGRILMRNEAKIPFHFNQDGKEAVVVSVEPGKYISTTLINVDVQPTYVRITVKDKLLQFPFEKEVAPSLAKVQRSTTTGQLMITIPYAPQVLQRVGAERKLVD